MIVTRAWPKARFRSHSAEGAEINGLSVLTTIGRVEPTVVPTGKSLTLQYPVIRLSPTAYEYVTGELRRRPASTTVASPAEDPPPDQYVSTKRIQGRHSAQQGNNQEKNGKIWHFTTRSVQIGSRMILSPPKTSLRSLQRTQRQGGLMLGSKFG